MALTKTQLKSAALAAFGYNVTLDGEKDTRVVDAIARAFIQACVDTGNTYTASSTRTAAFDMLWERAAFWKVAEVLVGGDGWVEYYKAYQNQVEAYQRRPPKQAADITPP